jgi:hypothetical protein
MSKKLLLVFLSLILFPNVIFSQANVTYHKVDPKELPFDFNADVKNYSFDKDGNCIEIEGEVVNLLFDGQPIMLETKKLTKIGNDCLIITKDYGKIKVTMDYQFGAALWLTDNQLKQFKELKGKKK